eukprot:416459_1
MSLSKYWTCRSDIISSKTSYCVIRCFEIFAAKVYHKPWLFILLGIIITILCAIGLINFERVEDDANLYALNNNNLYDEYTDKINYFGEEENMFLLVVGKNDKNIINAKNLPILKELMHDIYSIRTMYNGNWYNYTDICVQQTDSNQCKFDSVNFVALFFDDNPRKYKDPYIINNVLNHGQASNLFCGNAQHNNVVYLDEWQTGANTFLITYPINTYNDDSDYYAIKYEFQESYKQYWINDAKNKYDKFNIHFYTQRNRFEEINSIAARNAPIMAIGFMLMLIYLIFVLSEYHNIINMKINFRFWLPFSTIISLLFSMVIAFGLSALLGFKVNSMIYLIPFLLLGIGVDDDIIIVDYFKQTKHELLQSNIKYEPHILHSKALGRSGLSISVTSFCTVTALLAGLFSHIDAIISFSVHAAFAFFANYVLQFLFFYPMLIYEEKRIDERRNCCCPCRKHDINDDSNHKKNYFIFCKTMIINFYVSIFRKSFMRWIIIITFIGITCISAYCIQFLDVPAQRLDTVPTDSFSSQFFENYYDAFSGSEISKFELVIDKQDFLQSEVRQNVLNVVNDIESSEWSIYTIDNWLQEFISYLKYDINPNIDIDELSLNSTKFYQYLTEKFLMDDNYKKYASDIVLTNKSNTIATSIIATKFNVFGYAYNDYQKRWNVKLDSEHILNKYNVNGFMYMSDQYSWYGAVVRLSLTLQNMMYSFAAVSIVLFLFIEIKVTIITLIALLMININLLGWFAFFGVGVDTVVFVCVIMTVGITVDYIIHMTQFYIVEIGQHQQKYDSDEKVLKYVMENIGVSVFKAAFSTFLGGFTLIFSSSNAFVKFFYSIVGVVVVAAVHALFFVPCVSTQFLWLYKNSKNNTNVITDQMKTEIQMSKVETNIAIKSDLEQ